MTQYFENVKTLDELKKQYRRLAIKYHPDMGGSTEIMQQINAEHDRLFEQLKTQHNASADEYHQTTETPEEFRAIIELLMKLDGLEIELAGAWLWIGGNTRAHKEALKAAGCRWSSNKKLWYWRHGIRCTGRLFARHCIFSFLGLVVVAGMVRRCRETSG